MWLTRRERVTLTVLGSTALLALTILLWQRQRAPLTIVESPPSIPSTVWDATLASARQIDLNQASASTLQRLPGIGPVLAERIVAYRVQHGRFQDPQELRRIHGIGPKALRAIEDYVTVRGE